MSLQDQLPEGDAPLHPSTLKGLFALVDAELQKLHARVAKLEAPKPAIAPNVQVPADTTPPEAPGFTGVEPPGPPDPNQDGA